MTEEDRMKKDWQSSGNGHVPPIDDVRTCAARFGKQIRRRNMREYVAGALAIGYFGWVGIRADRAALSLACGLIVAGLAVVLWQLARRGSTLEAKGSTPVLAHYRAELDRQRAAVASVLWWYLLPLVPGMLLFILVTGAGGPPWATAARAGFCAMVFGAVFWLNRLAARKLERQIGELDSLA